LIGDIGGTAAGREFALTIRDGVSTPMTVWELHTLSLADDAEFRQVVRNRALHGTRSDHVGALGDLLGDSRADVGDGIHDAGPPPLEFFSAARQRI
jgi:hypothetical protein